MTVTCYPMPGKAKSGVVLRAFAAGAAGKVADHTPPVLSPGAAAFYGVIGLEHLLRMARHVGHDWYYGDNAYFDCARQQQYRFSKNAFQQHELVEATPERFEALGLSIKPWQTEGRHIVVVEQSEHFLQMTEAPHWLLRVVKQLQSVTKRELRIRRWQRNKQKASATLQHDLKGAWALVTHMSAAANEALLAGVPVFTSGKCAATPLASGELSSIEQPRYPDNRAAWAAGLAARQWTLEEIAAGTAWKALNGI